MGEPELDVSAVRTASGDTQLAAETRRRTRGADETA